MVDPQACNRARLHQIEDQAMRLVKHRRILGPDADQARDVEETAMCNGITFGAPMAKPPELPVMQMLYCGAVHLLMVLLHRVRVQGHAQIALKHDRAIRPRLNGNAALVQDLLERGFKHRQRKTLVRHDIEATEIAAFFSLCQDVAQPRIVERECNMVWHDVQNDTNPQRLRRIRQPVESVAASQITVDLCRVNHIIPMGRSRLCREYR